MKNNFFIISTKTLRIVVIIACLSISGCKKFVTVETPVTSISTENAFKDEATASAVLTGTYAQMNNDYFYGIKLGSLSVLSDLAADNLSLFDLNFHSTPDFPAHYLNQLTPQYVTESNQTWWRSTYELLYSVNFSIEQLKDNVHLREPVKKRLLGEAYFLRAFHYFYLVNLYGAVPLVVTTDYKTNSSLARAPESVVYDQILSDLTLAENLLDNIYVAADLTTSTNERIRPNLASVNALKARVFLYQKKYADAETAATKVIIQSQYALVNLEAAFLKNSKETIWALQSVVSGYNTVDANVFLIPSTGPTSSQPIFASMSLVNSFAAGDDRKNKWMGNVSVGSQLYYFPAKYKVNYGATSLSEYQIVLRLSEQYLIRAEARNEQNNTIGAIDDLNTIRTRSRANPTTTIPDPLPNIITTLGQAPLRALILKERRLELFAEWGHRWFDLKRSGTIDAELTAAAIAKGNGANWQNFKALYPIPVNEIVLDPAITQNPGYSK